MKRINHVLAFLLLVAGSFVELHSQDSPCLRIDNESTNCSVSVSESNPKILSGNSLNFLVSDDPRSLGLNAQARYKAFWIFGDGNFRYYPLGDMDADLTTLVQPYSYHQVDTYYPTVLLTERKSDTSPPRGLSRVVSASIITATGSTFTQTLSTGNKTLDILNSDKLRPKYPTAFAISIPIHSSTTGIYFFYNSRNNGETFVPDTVQVIESVELPRYVSLAGLSYTNGLTSNLPTEIQNGITQIQSQFRNYIYLPVSSTAINRMPSSFSEYRFFPVLKTIWANGLPITRFAAISVGTTAPSSSNSFYTEARMASLTESLSDIFPSTAISTNFIIGQPNNKSTLYVTGASVANLEMVGSIDPNEIKVLAIADLGEGKSKVTCRLEACNKGRVVEDIIDISINDHENLFTDFKVLSTDTLSVITEKVVYGTHQWKFEWTALLDEVPYTGAYEGEFESICNNLIFSIETNKAGLQRLLAGDGLELCIRFRNANARHPECVCNLPVEKSH